MSHPPGLLFVPAVAWMWTRSAIAIARLMGKLPPGSHVAYDADVRSTIGGKREAGVETMLREPSLRWILFVDSDNVPPPDACERLLRHGKPIVSGLYFERHPPYRAMIGKGGSPVTLDGGLQATDRVGGGCLLVQREVFETMPRPWFPHVIPTGEGEDAGFSLGATKAGYELLVDTGLVVGHMAGVSVDLDFSLWYDSWPRP